MSKIENDFREMMELQEKHRIKLQAQRDKVKERKARTRRLIKRGAIAEGFVGEAENMTDDEFYQALKKLCGMSCD